MDNSTSLLPASTRDPSVVVGVLIYNSSGEILLAQIAKWKDRWVVVGGHLDAGESLEDCARREVKEETNLDITDLAFVHVQEAIYSEEFGEKRHFVFLNYSGLAISDDIKLDEELSDTIWIRPEAALAMDLNSSTRRLILAFLENMR